MKATIQADGTLYVAAETALEAYALDRWGRDNLPFNDARVCLPKMIVYHGLSIANGSETLESLVSKPI
ncbi:hypothetical protein B0G76_1327 [Paraburkholderia sp. BL23I1N1]|uniref:hypothetical protein n=1 Tax=Paraburkholderia sp. BL23I1N1 TaxID=1938802 RepID=UPI000E76C8E1|nr:hypothetical protein [Paraburkholderia sp. BL23I1N1]RKE35266.1 hypothetical protein B0G76_1327 [Paraburkholderia sp. BL23I1N1]